MTQFGIRRLKQVWAALFEPPPAEQAQGRVHEGPRNRQSVNKHTTSIRSVFQLGVKEDSCPAASGTS